MGEKNRQHYVPQFYLRNFSNTGKSIAAFNIGNSKYIQNASIRDMCQKHNFYGADKIVENFLDEKIERKASIIINSLLNKNAFPDNMDDYLHLAMFLLISEGRNLKFADSNNNMIDYLAKSIIRDHPDFADRDIESFKVRLKQPANLGIQVTAELTPAILDLEPLLIIEQTGARKFITSDNPLVRYNSFYINKGYNGGFGYTSRGLQLFFPISPQKCILLYDPYAYDIPDTDDGILILKKAREVDKLNELFYLNAYNNVFSNQITRRNYIEGIHNKNKSIPKIKELNREVASFKSLYSNSELFHFRQNRVSKAINFSWMRISQYANTLQIPSHMGGIHREESTFIRDILKKSQEHFTEDLPPFQERVFRAE